MLCVILGTPFGVSFMLCVVCRLFLLLLFWFFAALFDF